MRKLVFTKLIILSVVLCSLGQAPDTTFSEVAIANTWKLYTQGMKGQLPLYNGSRYHDYQPLQDEHPYFLNDDWQEGSVLYNGNRYAAVALLYNIFTDEVILENYNGGSMTLLIAERVQSFSLGDRTFIRLDNELVKTGFYEILYDGDIKVYAKRIKEFSETISSAEIVRTFNEKVKYFILRDGRYYPVKSKGSVFDLFKDHKKELARYMRDTNLSFKKNREHTLVKLTEYYTGL